MNLLVLGINHRTAPVELRDRFALARDDLSTSLESLKQYTSQGVVLSTCNRTEVYTVVPALEQGRERVVRFLEHMDADTGRLPPHLYTLEHLDAARHLFRVASGLDSLILGETEILGQVREAFGIAAGRGTAHGVLSHTFHHALRVGKRARRDTAISRNALSISSACVELARRALGDLQGREVLVIGVGEAGKLAAQALKAGGAGTVWVANRTYERAAELAQELGGHAAPFEGLGPLLRRVDVAVSTTGAPGFILSADDLEAVAAQREASPLFVVDIAVPRDIDPDAAEIPGIVVHNLDDLEAIAEGNRRLREQEARKVEGIVEEEVQRFGEWWDALKVVPTVAALNRQAEGIRQRELEKTLKRMPHLSEEEQQRLDAMSRAIVKRLLHDPIAELKNGTAEDMAQAARQLFHLGEREDGPL